MNDFEKRQLLGIRIKEQRKLNNMSQTDLGNKLGIKFTTISKYESGEIKSIDSIMLNKISKILDCSIDYLLGRTDNPKSDIFGSSMQLDASLKDNVDLSEFSDRDKDILKTLIEQMKKKKEDN